MARRCWILLLVCVLLAGIESCGGVGGYPPPTSAKDSGSGVEPPPAAGTEDDGIVTATQVDPREERRWLTLSDYEGDLDGDGSPEKLQLLVRADRSPEDGEIAWDDGQPWLLLVADGGDYYPVFSKYVQLGAVYFSVYEDSEGQAEIEVLVTTGAGLGLSAVTFNTVKRGYRVEEVYASKGDNLRHTSFQPYR